MSNIGSNFWFCVSNVHPMIFIEIQFGGDGNHLRFQIGNKNINIVLVEYPRDILKYLF
jgi:hypothetical protein